MSEFQGMYDEYGVFTLSDAALFERVAGGNVVIYVTTGLHGIYGGDLGCQSVAVPTDQADARLNWRCRYYYYPHDTTYNVLCQETAGGMNPVCFTNAGC